MNTDIVQLLDDCQRKIEDLRALDGPTGINKVTVKNTLENLRSALDYHAVDLATKLNSVRNSSKKSAKIYFPYGQKQNHFKRSLNSNLPDLQKYYPKIYDLLKSVQPFSSDQSDSWVVTLCNLTNEAKHNNLSKTQSETKRGVSIPGILDSVGGSGIAISNTVNGVRQDDVFMHDDGNVNIVKNSGTSIIYEKNIIKFHGMDIEIIPFLENCLVHITRLSYDLWALDDTKINS